MNKKDLIKVYNQLRVSDVRDGMDWVGLHPTGTVSSDIRPVWRTKMVGFARTARYIQTNHVPPKGTPAEYTEYLQNYWKTICTEPFMYEIEEGDIVVLDASNTDIGIVGSLNSFNWTSRGARGVLTNGGARDTDEIILQKVPVFSRFISQKMPIARAEYDTKDIPVNIGGQIVHPGDVIIADNDGVMVVPIERAEEVAKYAMEEQIRDRQHRRRVYDKMSKTHDETVTDIDEAILKLAKADPNV